MRYIRKELSIVEVCNEDISDLSVIKTMFETMFKEQSDASVVYYSKGGGSPMSYERVRVSAVHNDAVDLQIFQGNAVMKSKGILMSSFVQVQVTSSSADKYFKRNSGDRLRFLDME